MRKSISAILFLLWIYSLSLAGQTTSEIREQYKPGRLETLLMTTPNASVAKKNVGMLSSPTSASFTAILATDPTTKAKIGGLEVHFTGKDLNNSIYLDEDCLVRLQKSLKSLEAQRHYVAEQSSGHDSADVSIPRIVVAYNDYSSGTLPDGRTGKVGILSVGYYRYEGGFGVYLAPTKPKAGQDLQLYFQNATLTELSKFLQDAQIFLHSN